MYIIIHVTQTQTTSNKTSNYRNYRTMRMTDLIHALQTNNLRALSGINAISMGFVFRNA